MLSASSNSTSSNEERANARAFSWYLDHFSFSGTASRTSDRIMHVAFMGGSTISQTSFSYLSLDSMKTSTGNTDPVRRSIFSDTRNTGSSAPDAATAMPCVPFAYGSRCASSGILDTKRAWASRILSTSCCGIGSRSGRKSNPLARLAKSLRGGGASMGSVGREQSGFASTRAREALSQNSTRPGWKGEGGIPSSADVPLLAAVKGWCSHPRWPRKKTSQTRLKSRDGSTIVLRLRILIMLPDD